MKDNLRSCMLGIVFISSLLVGCSPDVVSVNATVGMTEYEVQASDTIIGIARRFGIAPETVLMANSDTLMDDPMSLRPGMRIWIPPENGAIHEWNPEDSWQDVSRMYGVGIDVILQWEGNGLQDTLDSSTLPRLSAGSRIFIPGGDRPLETPDNAVPRGSDS